MNPGEVFPQLDDLRRAFDQAFAVPPAPQQATLESWLVIRVDGESCALRVGELAGLERRRKIVALPCVAPAFLGLAGIKGQLVPVYSLASLLGLAGADVDEGRWLAVCGAGDPVGLAFAGLQGYVRLDPSAFSPLGEEQCGREHVQGVLRLASAMCYVLSVPSILAAINRRASRPGSAQEG